jgi:hypothetical protein
MSFNICGIQATPDALRSIDSATFTGAYQAVGAPLSRNVRLVKFINNSTMSVKVSWDGIVDNDFVPANSFALYDITSDKVKDDGWFISTGTQFYVKGAAGVGLFYIVCLGA